ncbi:GspE/PulE family protein [Clostridium sp. DJ247]|uniref:GspE/PulE family protein n=1 Tax=Clostridium sp. DJ247 TaxID=2726188 RepID=UPI001F4C66B6|nr:GspE/PulE family protein [Clostridium sp. DJ247]
MKIDRVDLENTIINNKSLMLLPEKIVIENKLIAFNEVDNNLYVAISEEPSISLIEELRFISGKNIKLFFVEQSQIVKVINNYYRKYSLQDDVEIITTNHKNYPTENYEENLVNVKEDYEEAPTIKITNSLISAAIYKNASDIHIEPGQDSSLIRFRIDGIITKYMPLPMKIYITVCTRIKVMASMDIAERRMPQDGKIKYMLDDKNYDLRVSTLPTIYGEKIVIRILYKSKKMQHLDSLGFSEKDVKMVRSMIYKPNGLILVTGPTGSGKTTTLYSMLNSLDKKKKNIVSIEDPVEYTLSNINQVNVNTKIGFTFAEGLRSILRQDPDVIMVGEIRDEETAQIAVRAAITGHLVITTLHTSDAAESILRLEDMGIPSYFLKDALVGIVAQRLVRKICPYCKNAYEPSEHERQQLNLTLGNKLYKGNGCWRCSDTGYNGRTAIYEIVDMKKFRNKTENYERIEALRRRDVEDETSSMKNNCINLVKNGITSYEEFMRIHIDSIERSS